MMKRFDFDNESGVLSTKETYTYPQPEGLVSVQDFLFTSVDGERCVLIRWAMEADFHVDRFTFELKQLDAAGECLGETTVTYEGMDIPPAASGELFVSDLGIPVTSRCSDIRVQLIELISGEFVYRVKGTLVEVDYRPEEAWLYDKRAGRKEKLKDKTSLRVYSKCRVRGKRRWFVTLLAVILLAVVIFFPMIRLLLDPYVQALKDTVKDLFESDNPDEIVTERYDSESETLLDDVSYSQ